MSDIYNSLRKIKYRDYHFHWEKDEWYPNGSFENMGKKPRNPLELIFHDLAGGRFMALQKLPFTRAWEFIKVAIENEAEAYKLVQPLFDEMKNDSMFAPLLRGFEILYDMDGIDLSNEKQYRELSAEIKKAYSGGVLEHLPEAYEKAGMDRALNIWNSRYLREHFDSLSEAEQEKEKKLMPGIMRFDYMLAMPFRFKTDNTTAKWFRELVQDIEGLPVQHLEEPWKDAIAAYLDDNAHYLASISFSDYLKLLDKTFDYFIKRGIHGLKSACCFARGLDFRKVSEKDAEKAFRLMKDKYLNAPPESFGNFDEPNKIFEDFIFFRCIEKGIEHGIKTVQIHTGQRSGDIELARPALLEELIKEFPSVNFVTLHGGKDFFPEVIELCRNYDNVFADFTWIPILVPELAEKMVYEFLKYLPYRTCAGLDMANVEGEAGMADINRRLISRTLQRLLNENRISTNEEAIKIAENIINVQPAKLFPKAFN